MKTIFRKFFFEGFESGEFMFGTTHILSIIFVIVSVVLFTYLLRNKEEKYIIGKMKIIAIISLVIYFARRFLYYDGSVSLIEALWPFIYVILILSFYRLLLSLISRKVAISF